MKNAKRWLSVLLSVAVVLTMAITPAMAAGADNDSAATITVETAKQAVKEGDEVALKVSIANNPGFAAFDFTVQYDASKLNLKKIEKASIDGNFTGNVNTGKVNFVAAADQGECTGDGMLFTLTFTVKADCSSGANVTLQTTTFKNASNGKINVSVVPGGISETITAGGDNTGSTTGGSGSTGGSTGGSGSTGGTTGGSGSTGGSTGGSGSTGGVAKDNVTVTPATPTVSFTDVPASAYYYDAVKWAAKKGITSGIGSGLFGPDQPCTRAQIVTFLWRAAGSPEPKSMSSFSDVSADSYYAKAVAWAVENGITTGTGDGKFSPDATCTRAQSVTFLFRAIGKLVDSKAEFSDVLTDSYYANAVAWAVENGVTNGIGDGLFGPDNSCTRAQIVTFLFRAYQGK